MKRDGDGGVKIEGLGGKLCGTGRILALINNRQLFTATTAGCHSNPDWKFSIFTSPISDHLIRICVFRDQQGYFAFLYIQISTS